MPAPGTAETLRKGFLVLPASTGTPPSKPDASKRRFGAAGRGVCLNSVKWGFSPKGYKSGSGKNAALGALMNSLEKQVPWLQLTEDARKLCRRSDDAFDALIAALVARAAALGFTDAPPREISAAAETEGWIHLPAAHSLRDLAGHP